MGSMIEFQRPDGQKTPGYWAMGNAQDPAVVVLQEWWGLNPEIKQVADRLAAAGYQALVPDLYRGKLAVDAAEAEHMMSTLNWGDAVSQDIQGGINHLKAMGQKVGVIGFCMGGALTLISAANLTGLTAAVCYYGIPPAQAADPAQIKIPLLAHFAIQDEWCNPTAVSHLESQLQAGGVDYELHRYEAQHAFANSHRPEVYDPASAELAWERSLGFLKARLS